MWHDDRISTASGSMSRAKPRKRICEREPHPRYRRQRLHSSGLVKALVRRGKEFVLQLHIGALLLAGARGYVDLASFRWDLAIDRDQWAIRPLRRISPRQVPWNPSKRWRGGKVRTWITRVILRLPSTGCGTNGVTGFSRTSNVLPGGFLMQSGIRRRAPAMS